MPAPKRLLALDVRTSKIGFAVFEGPTSLLDWGVRSFEKGRQTFKSTISDRLDVLLAFYEPVVIVIRKRSYHLPSHKRAQTKILAIIKSESKCRSKRLTILTAKQVWASFAENREIAKHDIALRVANQFRELSWKLPRRRKTYQSELAAMLVFDAVANGMAYFRRYNRSYATVQPEL